MRIEANIVSAVLVGRPAMAVDTIKQLVAVSDIFREHPLFAYYLPHAVNRRELAALEDISPNVRVRETTILMPRYAHKEMFYSRTNSYARSFARSRAGYLDMCFWRTNFFLEPDLAGADYLLSFDDDSDFIRSPDRYLLDSFGRKGWTVATAGTWRHVSQRELDTRERLFDFTKKFVNKYRLEVADEVLGQALKTNDEARPLS